MKRLFIILILISQYSFSQQFIGIDGGSHGEGISFSAKHIIELNSIVVKSSIIQDGFGEYFSSEIGYRFNNSGRSSFLVSSGVEWNNSRSLKSTIEAWMEILPMTNVTVGVSMVNSKAYFNAGFVFQLLFAKNKPRFF